MGQYMIEINARFFNETYEETFTGYFWLTVWDDPEEIIPWFPEDPIEYVLWDTKIREDMIPEPFDAEKPIPYVHSLSTTGELVIGWDRSMVPPSNYTELP